MRNVLLVGEDVQLLQNLRKIISSYFDAIHIASFYEGAAHIQLCSPFADVVCVDVDSIMGFSIEYFEKISKNSSKKLLFLTSNPELEKLQAFLKLPGADYVLKPYHPAEVVVRLCRLLHASSLQIHIVEQPFTEIVPGLVLDEKGSALLVDGQRRRLPKILRAFFEVLAQNRNTVVSHEHLNEKIWGDYYDMGVSREIRAHAKRLRNIMGRYASLLVNVKAQGYMLSVDEPTPQ